MQPRTQAQQAEMLKRQREQNLAKFRTMGEAEVRRRYASMKSWEQPVARAYLREVEEANAATASSETRRRAAADWRDKARTLVSVLSLPVSIIAIVVSLLALFRPDWARLPPLP